MSARNESRMKALLATRKRPTYLLGSLERYLLLNPESQDRATDVLHPSEITSSDWCIRYSWHLLNGEKPEAPNHGFRLLSIFAEGHAIHDKWQHWLTRMDILRGAWQCDDHGPWWGLRSDTCVTCPHVRYREVPILHDDFVISGKADGWVCPPGEPPALLEIKSIGTGTIRSYGGTISPKGLSASFQQINRPFNGHVRQAMLYLYCLRWMRAHDYLDEDPPEQIVFVYECKEDQAAREFLVKYNEEYIETTLELLRTLQEHPDSPPACTGTRNDGEEFCAKCGVFG